MAIVEKARLEDLAPAFRLIFRHCPTNLRENRIVNALEMVRRQDLDPEGVFVVRTAGGVMGAMVCQALPGAGGLVWPPQVETSTDSVIIENQLIQRARAWLKARGTKLAQALLSSQEAQLTTSLERNGFRHITSLWYMRHNLEVDATHLPTVGVSLRETTPHAEREVYYQPSGVADPALFRQTLVRTYDGTLDCPEVNGVRDIGEIIEGHKGQGVHEPNLWWLALAEGKPIGVLLLAPSSELEAWDVSYVGIVPEARRHRFGLELARKAILEARLREATQLTLSVDARNRPAWNLYRKLGFEPYDQREVYLAIWSRE